MRAKVGPWVAAFLLATAPALAQTQPELQARAAAVRAPKRTKLWTEASHRRGGVRAPDFGRVARAAMKAVVAISVTESDAGTAGDELQKGVGAGFIIHEDGYILTSSHVVEGATQIDVSILSATGEPTTHRAVVVGEDPQTDFAVLKVAAGRKLPVLKLGSARSVDIADWLVVIGNPFGLAHSVTVGVVSFKGRTDVTPTGRSGYFDYIQTDASINPGNSGGPVLDIHGDVVAIANAVNVSGQGIGFAIPIDIAKEVVPQLVEHGRVRRGWLGISVRDLDAATEAKGKPGVLVSEVIEGSPAEKAGLRVGDVLTSLNATPLRKAQLLRWKVATAGVGKEVVLEVRRDGRPRHVSVQLDEVPQTAVAEAIHSESTFDTTLDIGASVSEVDAEASHRAGLAAPFGALVRNVVPGSAVEKAGVLPGDVILKVNRAEVVSHDEFVQNLAEVPTGAIVRLFVRRAGRTLFLAFRK